jgi:hypothetical protein
MDAAHAALAELPMARSASKRALTPEAPEGAGLPAGKD